MKVLFYFDQLTDQNKISGGVGVILNSLIRYFADQSAGIEFVFCGELVTAPIHQKQLSIINSSALNLESLLGFDVIIAIDRLGILRPYWHSLTKTKRFLYMHSWEIQEQMQFFDQIVCLSENHKSWLGSQGIALNKIEVIANGVDFSEFIQVKASERKKNSLLTVGAIIEHKGTHIILEAAQMLKYQIPDLSLTIVGAASLWNQSDQYERALKKNAPDWVNFLGTVNRAELSNIYAQHSLICSASKRETFGLVAVEAQGFGCIPVSFNVGGVSSTMLDGVTGRLYSPNSAVALSQAIRQTLSDIDQGLVKREKAEQFARSNRSVESMAAVWIDFLKNAVQKSQPLDAQKLLADGFSFCIISDGKRKEKLQRLVDSIRSQNLSHFEIIVAGKMSEPIEGLQFIGLAPEAESGLTSILRNRAMQAAKYSTIVMSDDDIVIDRDFASAVANFGRKFDILCINVRNPDGSRYWDWATIGGPNGHRLLSYEEQDDFIYVSSAIFVISKSTLGLGYFDENRGFYAAEDVEFSQRLKAAGAKIEFCKNATALHDDIRYTQFDDYPRRIVNFHEWESVADSIQVKGVYAWDGKAYPMTEEVSVKLENVYSESVSFEFVISPLEKNFYSRNWQCSLICNSTVVKESCGHQVFKFAIALKPYEIRNFSLKCSDVVVALTKGAFRDQRAVAAHLLKPQVRAPCSNDLIIPDSQKTSSDSVFSRQGFSVFAPSMRFGDFSAATRAMIRDYSVSGMDFGLEFHNVDSWFSRLCYGFDSSYKEWTQYLKKRKYSGVNLVCADPAQVQAGFFRRAISSRPGYSFNMAVTGKVTDESVLEELKAYDQIFTFSYQDCLYFRSMSFNADLLSPKNYFNQSPILHARRLPEQRLKSVTLLIDRSSEFEPEFSKLLATIDPIEDISIVLYVVDDLQTLQNLIKKVDHIIISSGQQARMSQIIITSGTLEAIEELEFLKFSDKMENLLSGNLAERINSRLSA